LAFDVREQVGHKYLVSFRATAGVLDRMRGLVRRWVWACAASRAILLFVPGVAKSPGPLWRRMDAQPRHHVASLRRGDIPTAPGVYAFYAAGDDKASYVGKASSLRTRIWLKHLGRGRVMTGSALRRNVAEHLRIATAGAIKAGQYQLDDHELARVRFFIESCHVAWLTTDTPAEALDLETEFKREWLPELTRR
jgi:hypothetical protein